MSASHKIYYSFLHQKDESKVEETYVDSSAFQWTDGLEKSWQTIASEVLPIVNSKHESVKPYFAKDLVNKPSSWKNLSFYFWGSPMSKEAINSCPVTINILNNIPGLISASVSILEPGARINPHYGDTYAIIRCHLGLKIPA